MSLHLTVVGSSPATENAYATELSGHLQDRVETQVTAFSHGKELGQIVFVDGDLPDLDGALERIERKGRALFLIVPDGSPLPMALIDGRVDDVLVRPFRSLEVLSKVRHYQQILMWEEVSRMNSSFAELLQRLKEDLGLAERLQKNRLPVRFPEIRGLKVASRYLAGMRSGGDHFDVAESQEGSQLSLILSDSSSYGLASAVLSALMSVTLKLSSDESRSSRETVRRIHQELLSVLSEKDSLSLFYGVLSKKDLRLKYLNLGSSAAFFCRSGKSFEILPTQGASITRGRELSEVNESEISLQPSDRLALISDGFVEAVGGAEKTCELLDGFREKPAVDAINELVFKVKSKFAEPDDMPEQDCTAVLLDVDAKILRLA